MSAIDLYWTASLGKWVTIPEAETAAPEDAAAGAEAPLRSDGTVTIGDRPVKVGKRFYGEWVIYRDPPPIPTRDCDWQFYHKDFDGAEDAHDPRYGSAASLTDAIAQIEDMEASDD